MDPDIMHDTGGSLAHRLHYPVKQIGLIQGAGDGAARRPGGSCRNLRITYTLSSGQASFVDHLVTKPDNHSDRLLYISLCGLRIDETKPKHDFALKLGGA
ncbi:MAG: hypothetical protein ACREA0_13610, partial [bacterium]